MSLPPILSQTFQQFKQSNPNAKGQIVKNMDAYTKEEEFTLEGQFFVCSSNLHLDNEHIDIINQNGGFLGGRSVHLKANKISIGGTKEEPIQIVALGKLKIVGEIIEMRNVNLYLTDPNNLHLDSSNSPQIQNVSIYRISLQKGSLHKEKMATVDQFLPWIRVMNLLQKIRFDKECANKIGLKSILVEETTTSHSLLWS